MTDKQFERKIQEAVLAAKKHIVLLLECEAEYESRFGHNPSEADDDFWIDCVHQGLYIPTIAEVIENAELHSNQNREKKWQQKKNL